MNLYLVSQDFNDDCDTYDSMVVAAPNEDEARRIHPSPFVTHWKGGKWMGTYFGGPCEGAEYEQDGDDWVGFDRIDELEVELIGTTDKPLGVIIASFNAG